MLWLLPFAMLASALSFPAMLFERALPIWPTAEKLADGMKPDDWYRRPLHYLKNITSECVRADGQWWSKFLCFVIAVLAITVFVQLTVQ